MKLIPVIDLLGGQAVHAIGGRRHEYRPLAIPAIGSSDPAAVARFMLEATGAADLYVADLDAIVGNATASSIPEQLAATLGVTVWVDRGLHNDTDVVVTSPNQITILGTETLAGPEAYARLVSRISPQVALSFDLKQGQLLGRGATWHNSNKPFDLVQIAMDLAPVPRLIVLDLARVGESAGPGGDEFIPMIRHAFPTTELIVGGGIRDHDDIARLADQGVDGVLLATAILQGKIGRATSARTDTAPDRPPVAE